MKALVVPTYNRKNHLDNFLNCILNQTKKPDVIIVVNDNSNDGTKELLELKFPDIIQIIGTGDLWWTGSVNKGIDYVLKNFPNVTGIVLQNDDVFVKPDWFENLMHVAELNTNALIGCVAVDIAKPEIISYAGSTHNTWFAFMKKFHIGKNLSSFSSDMVQPAFDLIGRGCYIPVEVFNKIGLYDEIHFKHRGDTELPLRARIYEGYELLVTFKAVVYIDPTETSQIDTKLYSIGDLYEFFFDFRSSAFWKYRFYYAKIVANNNYFQWFFFFTFRMLLHIVKFISKIKIFN